MTALTDLMHCPVVGLMDHAERMTRMIFLAPALFLALGSQALGPRFFQTIAAGWLAIIATVFGQLIP